MAFRFFERNNVHHVLYHQRLEVELVAGGVVGRDGFGIVIDDDRFVAASRIDQMACTVE